MSLDISGLTTVPIVPLEHPSLTEELLSFNREREQEAVRQALLQRYAAQYEYNSDPIWPSVAILIGAMLMIMCGAFLIATYSPIPWPR